MLDSITQLKAQYNYPLPFYLSRISAGFPSPADDYMENALDLNELLITHPAATFFVRVSGHSMTKAGIHNGDILIVDRSLKATSGKIVVAVVDGQFTVKRLKITASGKVWLLAENDDFSDIEAKGEQDIHIWGVVTNVIHPV